MTTMKFLLAAFIGIALASAVHGCFPTVYTGSDSFTDSSNGNAVIYNAPISCNGTLDELIYYIDTFSTSSTPEEYFSVWKPLGNGRYEMQGKVFLSKTTVGEHTQVLTGADRLEVKEDWIIGLHKATSSGVSFVPYASDSDLTALSGTPYAAADLVDFSERAAYGLAVKDVWTQAFDGTEVRMPSIKPVVI